MTMHEDPDWPRASAWMAGECAGEPWGRLGVVGAPVRLGSITPGRCDLAPAAVREAMRKFSVYDLEAQTDLRLLRVEDRGDLPLADATLEQALAPLSEAVAATLTGAADAAAILGGDNGVTRPGVHGL